MLSCLDKYIYYWIALYVIIALALSRMHSLGVESSMMYFFCGLSVFQLMKLKIWVGIVAGEMFRFILILIRTILAAQLKEEQEQHVEVFTYSLISLLFLQVITKILNSKLIVRVLFFSGSLEFSICQFKNYCFMW